MIKSFGLLPKKPGLSDEQFHRHWREIHAPLALRLPGLRRCWSKKYGCCGRRPVFESLGHL